MTRVRDFLRIFIETVRHSKRDARLLITCMAPCILLMCAIMFAGLIRYYASNGTVGALIMLIFYGVFVVLFTLFSLLALWALFVPERKVAVPLHVVKDEEEY